MFDTASVGHRRRLRPTSQLADRNIGDVCSPVHLGGHGSAEGVSHLGIMKCRQSSVMPHAIDQIQCPGGTSRDERSLYSARRDAATRENSAANAESHALLIVRLRAAGIEGDD